MHTMTTRQKLIEKVIKAVPDVPACDVAEAVEVAFDYLCDALSRSRRIEIRGFGSFNIGERIISPTTNLGSVIYHHMRVRTINYRTSENLLKKLNA
jgi:nucleoid DNA-binding protein